jgi:serine/threonine protein phosphatase PrpC
MNKFEPVLQPPRPSKKDQKTPTEEVVDLTKEAVLEKEVGRDISGIRKRPGAIEDVTEEAADILEPGELQGEAVVDAFEIHGFKGLNVAATLEMKEERKGSEARNEDNIIADSDTGLIGVLDGLGGEGKAGDGAKASMSAERNIPEHFSKLLKTHVELAAVRDRLIEHQLLRKNPQTPELKATYQKQITNMVEGIIEKDPELGRKALALIEAIRQSNDAVLETGGKTTATVSFVHQTPNGERWAVVASTGDSPAMKRRKNGELVPITKEDSLLNSLLDSGELTEAAVHDLQSNPDKKLNLPLSLSLVQAMGGGTAEFEAMKKTRREVPVDYKLLKRAMIRSLGGSASSAEPALNIRRLEPGDELVIASDGLTDKYETMSGETDFSALAKEFKGDAITTDLDRVRKAAKKKVSAAKRDDDIAIVTARAV